MLAKSRSAVAASAAVAAVTPHASSPDRQSQKLFSDSVSSEVDVDSSSCVRVRSRSPRILARAVPPVLPFLDCGSPVYLACQGPIQIDSSQEDPDETQDYRHVRGSGLLHCSTPSAGIRVDSVSESKLSQEFCRVLHHRLP